MYDCMRELETDRELDRMYEAAAAQDWEEQTATKKADSEMLKLSARSLGWAIEELDNSADFVNEAAENLVDTPEGDRVSSILADMETMLAELRKLKKKFGGEEK